MEFTSENDGINDNFILLNIVRISESDVFSAVTIGVLIQSGGESDGQASQSLGEERLDRIFTPQSQECGKNVKGQGFVVWIRPKIRPQYA
jgi:hypothetical protein